ncbi:enoyl-CoA hydratase/isomerase family protein [Nitratireductor soli]|uniref:enoyl-CoA hydratase/isomerase family protein n=1 Tax=Nitratireductor soli TaxID=1670619 RepID=UPI00065E99A3|nr:enoyl-CoA hydratase/isomerase family protein [Nitratireductor soli]
MLQLEKHGKVLVLRLNNPAKLNAWSGAVREDLRKALASADKDPQVAAAVITGTGGRSFCAGADLSDVSMSIPSAAAERMAAFKDFYLGIQSFRKPLVAALNGFALGSAFQAVLLMDYRVGHAGVRFGLPEINSGMPCITGSAILSWSVGPALARSIAVSGRFMEAQEASNLGMLEEIVPAEAVEERSLQVADELAAKSPEAFAETKLWLRDLTLPELDAAFVRAAEVRAKEEITRSVKSGISGFFAGHKARNA